jgi:hypothetical protein
MNGAPALLVRWHALAARADAHFARVLDAFPTQMHCHAGCCACCAPNLSVMLVEALAVCAGLEALPRATRVRLAAAAAHDLPASRCALLLSDRCAVYAWRPLICRTHGLPVLQTAPAKGAAGSADAPGEIGCCALNFAGCAPGPPASFPAAAVLDGERLTATLVVVDALVRRELDGAAPQRVSLTALARAGSRALPPVVRRRLCGT